MKQQDLDRLIHTIRDFEARIKVFKHNLDLIEKEVDHLTTIEVQIEENIKFLRKKHIIALALEYRRAKEELKKTQTRLAMIRIDRENIRRACSEIEEMLTKYKTMYAEYLKGPNNILQFKGKKDGQE